MHVTRRSHRSRSRSPRRRRSRSRSNERHRRSRSKSRERRRVSRWVLTMQDFIMFAEGCGDMGEGCLLIGRELKLKFDMWPFGLVNMTRPDLTRMPSNHDPVSGRMSCIDLTGRPSYCGFSWFMSCVSSHWPDTNCQWPSDPVLSVYEIPQFLHSAWQNFAAVLMTLLILVKVVIWYAGCRQLLEILEISLNLYGPPGNFCVKCRWLTALVSSHDKTGYQISYLRNWSPFFIFASCHGPMLCISCFCSIFRQTSRFGTLHSRLKQCKHVLDFFLKSSWNLLEICSVKFVDTAVCHTCVLSHIYEYSHGRVVRCCSCGHMMTCLKLTDGLCTYANSACHPYGVG